MIPTNNYDLTEFYAFLDEQQRKFEHFFDNEWKVEEDMYEEDVFDVFGSDMLDDEK